MQTEQYAIHPNHSHVHSKDCGHTAILHDGHTDYLHDGHLHHMRADGVVEEHVLPVTTTNPDACAPLPAGVGHDAGHRHGPNCGHAAVPHGDHVDYLVDGRLHHPHQNHCDDHGPVQRA